MQHVVDALQNTVELPPRHRQGCPKNYLRVLIYPYARIGYTAAEIDEKLERIGRHLPCTCEE
ncbi:MAG: hypothetical protein A2Y89_06745 [Chloroflexi bacterium RBG_13_51_18]|nr:MAG: hypothetical protein A2Y89_06745 [Chloroflexi bacterium RBG_13_51_18]